MIEHITTNNPIDSVPYGTTVIPQNRLKFLSDLCHDTLTKVPGNILEIGVYKGGTFIELANVLKAVCPEYKAIGIDTFTGHPYSDGHPVHYVGKYSDTDINELEDFLTVKGLDGVTKLYKGKIEDIFHSLNLNNVSFAHIDCDLYEPIKFCSKYITPLISKGGIIYFDDYGHDHCPGATKAIEEIFNKSDLNVVALPDGTRWSAFIKI